MASARLVRQVYAFLCEQIPEHEASRRSVFESACAMVTLSENLKTGHNADAHGGSHPMHTWATDTMIERHGWRLLRQPWAVSNGAFDDEDNRHTAAYRDARQLMEYGL